MRFAFPPYGAQLRIGIKQLPGNFIGVQVISDSGPGVGWNGWGHGNNYLLVRSFLDSRTARKWAC
jgi:hypothetical protein